MGVDIVTTINAKIILIIFLILAPFCSCLVKQFLEATCTIGYRCPKSIAEWQIVENKKIWVCQRRKRHKKQPGPAPIGSVQAPG